MKLEADIRKAEEAGDSELADALREVGYAGKWLDRPTGTDNMNAAIRRQVCFMRSRGSAS